MGESVRGADKSPLISVIVPVYKVEPYLHRCVDSILSQTYTNLEIILVDDGSPDNCPTICDEYAKTDKRVKVIHKENGGLSDARNVGMAAASGEYLMFVDSDDWLENNAVETLSGLSQKYDAQIVIGGMQRIEDGTDRIIKSDADGSSKEIVMSNIQAMEDFFENGCAAWARLYRKEIHDKILFPAGEINEDEAIVLKLLERCKSIVRTNQVIYNYRCRPESITTSEFSEKKLAWYLHCKDNLEWVKEHHPELEPYAAKRLCGSILYFADEAASSDKENITLISDILIDLRKKYRTYSKSFPDFIGRTKLFILRNLPFGIYRIILKTGRYLHEKI